MATRARGLSEAPQTIYLLKRRCATPISHEIPLALDDEAVTPETLAQNLAACESLQLRPFSPRFQEYLRRFQEQLEEAKWRPDSEEVYRSVNRHKQMVRSHFEKYQAGELPSDRVLSELQQFRVERFLLDYADYLTLELDRLRSEQRYKETEWNKVTDTWGKFVEVLEKEKEIREKVESAFRTPRAKKTTR
ncbi:MAG: hypothetical protein M1816_000938 [Peltula sp. TS41687]|nr:MAG: hypothetical protein M1816_000938 [Peltula sp. TS41687]